MIYLADADRANALRNPDDQSILAEQGLTCAVAAARCEARGSVLAPIRSVHAARWLRRATMEQTDNHGSGVTDSERNTWSRELRRDADGEIWRASEGGARGSRTGLIFGLADRACLPKAHSESFADGFKRCAKVATGCAAIDGDGDGTPEAHDLVHLDGTSTAPLVRATQLHDVIDGDVDNRKGVSGTVSPAEWLGGVFTARHRANNSESYSFVNGGGVYSYNSPVSDVTSFNDVVGSDACGCGMLDEHGFATILPANATSLPRYEKEALRREK